MSILNSIKGELQHIVETIHAITNVDITIVDENLQRLVATRFIKEQFGNTAPRNSVFEKCLSTGNQYFIENPKESPACIDCTRASKCQELAELCIPIRFNNKIIGVLGMCAFNEQARNSLLNNKDSYITFESQLSNIISTMLKEKEYSTLLEHRSSELITLLNSINEGIMFLDNNEKILTTNEYINKKLQLVQGHFPPLPDLITPTAYKGLAAKGFNGEVGPVTLKGFEFIISASPVLIKGKQKGTILVFSDFTKMRESVLQSARDRNIVTFDDIIGESEALLYAREMAIQVAEKDVAVLLMGETGTGKEVFAKAIHNASRRKNNIFLPINCSAIPENLLESELFGYEKGSFTGASPTGKQGKFEICKDGTLFLDEIGDLPFAMQAKLLRALEEKEITRVGGHTPIKVNPRIISATHKDLQEMVDKGDFREDLFYRLNVVPIPIPPLRERGYDIIILARYFLQHFSKVYNKDLRGFTAECENLLMGYSYPGNIRELRNLIEYATIFEKGRLVGTDNIKKKMTAADEKEDLTLAEITKRFEKTIIQDHIRRFGSSLEAKRKIAEKLGISIATLYRKLEE
jgi:transcriptional regulator with PAS, ATPase and Fis domain